MTKVVWRWVLVMALLVTAAVATRPHHVAAQDQPQPAQPDAQQIASVERLKADAFTALKSGRFEQSNELLAKAASLSEDPTVRQMASWINQFETQRQQFAAERHEQYEKAVADVKKLQAAKFDNYALDVAARAALLSDDKEAFRKQPWVDALMKQTAVMAEQYDKEEQWLKSMRLYADLGSIEPSNPLWKERLKLATRRIRLLALYTTGGIKALQESESQEREQVDQLLKPSTRPTTKPARDEEANDAFKIDWRDTIKGIHKEMLSEALKSARGNYYKQVEYRELLLGGLKGLRALATTKGLEKTFPGLGDEQKRTQFLAALDRRVAEAEHAGDDDSIIDYMLDSVLGDNLASVNIQREVIVTEFADGAFAELDPFSSMIWPADMEEFNKTTQGEFSGVGIQIQSDEDGSLRVVSPLEDSPAYKAGIKAGDIVTHIDGKNAKGITLQQAVKTITGKAGTHVVLTVRSPDNVVKDYDLERKTIHVASIKGWLHRPGGGWDYYVDPDNKIAYLRLTNFTKSTRQELDDAANELRRSGAKAMILDLRYNPGGLLSAATEVSDKFLSGGLIVRTKPDRKTPNPDSIIPAQSDGNEIGLPIVVLVNQYSASASEIVSGALKDHNRAKVVGERTFGKGSVQMLFPLLARSAYLKLTTSHYYLPNGKCIHREENSESWGVDPDLTIEMTPEQMRAAIEARQELDVLRDADSAAAAAKDEQQKLREEAKDVKDAVAKATKDPMASDPQLSAALLLLRMQLAGAQL